MVSTRVEWATSFGQQYYVDRAIMLCRADSLQFVALRNLYMKHKANLYISCYQHHHIVVMPFLTEETSYSTRTNIF
ncbi:hypothetical protein RRG08_033518 [Elysia crispata]|uniref:Uncharacterized protein n=1 Tax=Elysia crispata TaxID=231223 RepID=A0AAE0XP35_9GAST|nr:hypothetical protein RRG08_033518 [Elysia crispata]